MASAALLAIDWGTTNRRMYALDDRGGLIASERDELGLFAMAGRDFAAEVSGIRRRFDGDLVLCAGMVGSARGWTEVPYIPCPADLGALAAGVRWVQPGRAAIIPGLAFIEGSACDVMRGEEVQLLGAIVAGLAPANGLLCQPGTHCKWAHVSGGRIVRFRTSMTGEIFALLRERGLLAEIIEGEVAPGAAFRSGVAASAAGRLLGDLFSIRAADLLGLRARAEAASYASGLLIGSDVREQKLTPDDRVYVLADAQLGALYAEAIGMVGADVVCIDSHAAFIAGVTAIWRNIDAC